MFVALEVGIEDLVGVEDVEQARSTQRCTNCRTRRIHTTAPETPGTTSRAPSATHAVPRGRVPTRASPAACGALPPPVPGNPAPGFRSLQARPTQRCTLELYISVSFFFQHQKHQLFSRSPHVNEKFGAKTGSRTHFCTKILIHMRRTRKKHHFCTKPSGDPNRKSPLETGGVTGLEKPIAAPGSSSK